jgi:hypothetical protein
MAWVMIPRTTAAGDSLSAALQEREREREREREITPHSTRALTMYSI